MCGGGVAQSLFMLASARELLVPFFRLLVWCDRQIRTHDPPCRKRTLNQLSYRGGLEMMGKEMTSNEVPNSKISKADKKRGKMIKR